MATSITTVAGKGAPLNSAEFDANLVNLKTTADAAKSAVDALTPTAIVNTVLANDGPGTGLNADMVDGFHASATAGANIIPVADAVTGKISADFIPAGAGGVDADTLDGLDSLAFALTGHTHSNIAADTLDGAHASATPGVSLIPVADAVTGKIAAGWIPDGAGGGSADTVDGLHAFTTPTASSLCPLDATALVPLATIPATLTGKDADTVDGSHASAFALSGHNHSATYAPIAKGVTNGDTHDHSGGDGAQIAYSTLSGLPTLGTAADNAEGDFAVAAKGVTNGDSHDHSGGDGAQIAHTALSSIGTNTHAQIDTHISATNVHAKVGGINFVIDGGGSAITTGIKGDIQVPFACKITAARVLADASGAIAIGVWKDTYANFPPVVGDLIDTFSIAASGVKSEKTGLSIAVAAGSILRINVNSCATITRATLALTVERT